LRAKVETQKQIDIGLGHYQFETHRLEVTLGGKKWYTLERELQDAILVRAGMYVNHLGSQLSTSGYYAKHNDLHHQLRRKSGESHG